MRSYFSPCVQRRSIKAMTDISPSIKSLQPPPESKIYFAGCVYGLDYQLIPARSGFVQGQSDETLNCPSSPERSLSCPNNVVTRELSPLEKVIKSRQYDPKRAKRRSSKRW